MTNIVMLCKDRFRLTAQALETMYAGADPQTFTLSLIDDGSQDFRTRRLLSKWAAEKNNCTLVRVENSGSTLAALKNLGVKASELRWGCGRWLYLSDCDVAFAEGWLDSLIALAKRLNPEGFELFGGQVHPYHRPVAQGDGYEEVHMLDGPSWFMDWNVWDVIGPLRGKTPGVCKGEDVEFCQKAREYRMRIAVTLPHVVAHTGLTNSDGNDAPGRVEREQMKWPGVLYK